MGTSSGLYASSAELFAIRVLVYLRRAITTLLKPSPAEILRLAEGLETPDSLLRGFNIEVGLTVCRPLLNHATGCFVETIEELLITF